MEWNVLLYRYDNGINNVTYNIFKHDGFTDDVEALFKENLNREDFGQKLMKICRYWFWAKCEAESVIGTFPPYNDIVKQLAYSAKIDVYQQLEMNWDIFADYVFKYSQMN